MIKKISSIRNLGIFSNYTRPNDLDEFGRFNLFYGLNGSGKTTLSRFFLGLNLGGLSEYSDLEYKLVSDKEEFKNGQQYTRKIRVFNPDYIEANIGEIEGKLNPIFIIGEENKILVEQIDKDQASLDTLKNQFHAKKKKQENLEKDKAKVFTNIAKIIASETSGEATRNYRKPDAIKVFASFSAPQALTGVEITTAKKILRQTLLEHLLEIKFQEITLKSTDDSRPYLLMEALKKLEKITKVTCEETSNSQAIQRLNENSDISNWVEEGHALHEKHGSDSCEYCLQKIPQSRLDELAQHFNQSDLHLKEKIEKGIDDYKTITIVLNSISFPAKAELYDELQSGYQSGLEAYTSCKGEVISHISELSEMLEDKLKHRTEAYSCTIKPFKDTDFLKAFSALNELIQAHNKKSSDFNAEVTKARRDLEEHHLSTIKDEITGFEENIGSLTGAIKIITDGNTTSGELGTVELTKRIEENRLKVSNAHKAAADLTDQLQIFLGRSDLKFEAESEGYRIVRNGHAAKQLSEGEKTAITFIYFIVQLGDQDFDVNEGIVVIDDPVSSLDAGSVYQAFSFLKNAVKNAKQIFLFTHSYEFLKLLINWYKNIPNSEGRKSYYMLTCNIDESGKRLAKIEKLDKELLCNDSEYSFLFKILSNFKSDGTIAGSYHIPNIARKVLETYLEFHYPETLSMYKKLEKISFDEKKKTALLKFANDLSHSTGKGFDPALVPETQKNVQHLLEMMETVSPDHYESLKKSLESS